MWCSPDRIAVGGAHTRQRRPDLDSSRSIPILGLVRRAALDLHLLGSRGLIPCGCSGVKPPGPRFVIVFRTVSEHASGPAGRGGRRPGAGRAGQVVGLTALLRGREDRGRGGSPRLSGPVVAAEQVDGGRRGSPPSIYTGSNKLAIHF